MDRRRQIRMSEAELAAFLDAQRPLVCATLGPEGRPHLAALWYVPVDGRLDCWTYAASQKARNLERDPRATLLPVAKKSKDKGTIGGRKYALRRLDDDGTAQAEVIGVGTRPPNDHNDRPLLVPLVQQGEMVGRESLADARERHQRSFAELPLAARKMSRGESLLPTIYLDEDDHR